MPRKGSGDDLPPAWRPWEDPEWTPRGPIAVEGGLTTRSTRGAIGQQWWSKRFIEVMESFALGGRLTRGRSYARKGQVLSLDVDPGRVTASVQGSRATPYTVTITLKEFSSLVWAKAEVVVAEQAIHSARLLAGEFPPELEAVFEGIGAPLFPLRLGDLTMSCSCPDQAVPCKHVAAAFYLLAERFDDDPFLILRWRGRSREVLLGRLRELRGDESPAVTETPVLGLLPDGGTGLDGVTAPVVGAAWALGTPALVLAGHGASSGDGQTGGTDDEVPDDAPVASVIGIGASALGFWAAGEPPPLPSQPELPVDLLLRSLPVPPSALGGERLLAYLTPLYDRLP